MNQSLKPRLCLVVATGLAVCCCAAFAKEPLPATSQDRSKDIGSIEATNLRVAVYADGSYSIAAAGITGPVLRSDVEAVVDAVVLRSTAYPRHDVVKSEQTDGLGAGPLLTVTHTGLAGKPDLVSTFRLLRDQSWGEMAVEVRNATGEAISVQSIRIVHANAAPVVDLHGPAFSDRILSDSYSEDRPQLAIRDLGDTPKGLPGLHRAVGSQLIYNRTQRREPVPRRADLRSAADDLPSEREGQRQPRAALVVRCGSNGHDGDSQRRIPQGLGAGRAGEFEPARRTPARVSRPNA